MASLAVSDKCEPSLALSLVYLHQATWTHDHRCRNRRLRFGTLSLNNEPHLQYKSMRIFKSVAYEQRPQQTDALQCLSETHLVSHDAAEAVGNSLSGHALVH